MKPLPAVKRLEKAVDVCTLSRPDEPETLDFTCSALLLGAHAADQQPNGLPISGPSQDHSAFLEPHPDSGPRAEDWVVEGGLILICTEKDDKRCGANRDQVGGRRGEVHGKVELDDGGVLAIAELIAFFWRRITPVNIDATNHDADEGMSWILPLVPLLSWFFRLWAGSGPAWPISWGDIPSSGSCLGYRVIIRRRQDGEAGSSRGAESQLWRWGRLFVHGGHCGQKRRKSATKRFTGYNWTGKSYGQKKIINH